MQVSTNRSIEEQTARAEDRLTGEKVRSCFRSVASEKVNIQHPASLLSHLPWSEEYRTHAVLNVQGYVTELDLTRLQLPTKSLKFLKEHMPQSLVNVSINPDDNGSTGGETKEEVVLDYEEFLNQFLE